MKINIFLIAIITIGSSITRDGADTTSLLKEENIQFPLKHIEENSNETNHLEMKKTEENLPESNSTSIIAKEAARTAGEGKNAVSNKKKGTKNSGKKKKKIKKLIKKKLSEIRKKKRTRQKRRGSQVLTAASAQTPSPKVERRFLSVNPINEKLEYLKTLASINEEQKNIISTITEAVLKKEMEPAITLIHELAQTLINENDKKIVQEILLETTQFQEILTKINMLEKVSYFSEDQKETANLIKVLFYSHKIPTTLTFLTDLKDTQLGESERDLVDKLIEGILSLFTTKKEIDPAQRIENEEETQSKLQKFVLLPEESKKNSPSAPNIPTYEKSIEKIVPPEELNLHKLIDSTLRKNTSHENEKKKNQNSNTADLLLKKEHEQKQEESERGKKIEEERKKKFNTDSEKLEDSIKQRASIEKQTQKVKLKNIFKNAIEQKINRIEDNFSSYEKKEQGKIDQYYTDPTFARRAEIEDKIIEYKEKIIESYKKLLSSSIIDDIINNFYYTAELKKISLDRAESYIDLTIENRIKTIENKYYTLVTKNVQDKKTRDKILTILDIPSHLQQKHNFYENPEKKSPKIEVEKIKAKEEGSSFQKKDRNPLTITKDRGALIRFFSPEKKDFNQRLSDEIKEKIIEQLKKDMKYFDAEPEEQMKLGAEIERRAEKKLAEEIIKIKGEKEYKILAKLNTTPDEREKLIQKNKQEREKKRQQEENKKKLEEKERLKKEKQREQEAEKLKLQEGNRKLEEEKIEKERLEKERLEKEKQRLQEAEKKEKLEEEKNKKSRLIDQSNKNIPVNETTLIEISNKINNILQSQAKDKNKKNNITNFIINGLTNIDTLNRLKNFYSKNKTDKKSKIKEEYYDMVVNLIQVRIDRIEEKRQQEEKKKQQKEEWERTKVKLEEAEEKRRRDEEKTKQDRENKLKKEEENKKKLEEKEKRKKEEWKRTKEAFKKEGIETGDITKYINSLNSNISNSDILYEELAPADDLNNKII